MALSFVARLTILMLGMLSLLIAGGHLLPQAPPDLQDYNQLFMTSPVCETPCLMGISQGMLLSEAVQQLEAHSWVERVFTRQVNQFEARAFWIWSGQQPDFIDSQNRGFLYARAGQNNDIRQKIYQVQVITQLRFQDLYMAMGATDRGFVQYWPQLDMVTYDIRYPDSGGTSHVSLYTRVDCPAQLPNFFWYVGTSISQINGSALNRFATPQKLSTVCRNEGHWAATAPLDSLE